MDSAEYIRQSPIKSFRRGEVIVSAGDAIESLFAVREGFVKVVSISDSGVERIVWIAGRYDIVPAEQLFSLHARARFFYIAMCDGSYYSVDKADFLHKARHTPSMMEDIARGMSEHHDDVMGHLKAAEATTVRERLLRTLCYITKRFSAEAEVDLCQQGFRITHQELAAMIGATRETTSLELLKLRKNKLIRYDTACFVVYVDKINQLLD